MRRSWSRSRRGLKIKCLGFVSVSYHRVSFTSLYVQLFASLQNYTYIVLNARCLYCLLLIHMFCISSFNLNVVIHCFGTMLKVEGLEKRLGLGLARSRFRSCLVAKIRRLGLISVSWNCRKVLVLVSSRTKNRMFRSRLGLVS